MEYAIFWAHYASLFQERLKMQLKCKKKKKIGAVYGEGTVTNQCVKSGL